MARPKNIKRPIGPYVYTWFRPDTGEPFYVGVGVDDRAWHLSLRRNSHTRAVVQKFGFENIRIEIQSVESWADGLALEMELIASIGRRDLGKGPLTNQTDGGQGATGRPVSERTRKGVSNANSQRQLTDEQRARIREKLLGREVSKETRALLADRFRGKERPDHVKKILAANFEKVRDEFARWNKSEAGAIARRKAQEMTKEWHASPEGLAWHSENGAKAWIGREWFEKPCEHCGRLFKTPFPTRARFCHQNCKMRARSLRRGVIPRGPRCIPALEGKRKPNG
jgi:hypothetical protein